MREAGCGRHPLLAWMASSLPSVQLSSSIGSVAVADVGAQETAEILGLVDCGTEDQAALLLEGHEGILMEVTNQLGSDGHEIGSVREGAKVELEIRAMGGSADCLEAGGIKSETEKLEHILLSTRRKGTREEDLGG